MQGRGTLASSRARSSDRLAPDIGAPRTVPVVSDPHRALPAHRRRRTPRDRPVPWILAAAALACIALLAACGRPSPASSEAVNDPTATPCSIAPRPGDSTLQFASDGVLRRALVHVPRGVGRGRKVPILLALHGARNDGPSFAPYTGFSKIADREGFIAVYPTALDGLWNVGRDPHRPDDVRYLSGVVDRVVLGACADPRRLYATGLSNGGDMAALIGCQLSNFVSAVAPVASGYTPVTACRPKRPVSVLEIHGTGDRITPYAGRRPRHAGSVPRFLAGWVSRDGCSATPQQRREGRTAVRLDWRGCRGGSAVAHIRVRGGGHEIPGASPRRRRGTVNGPEEIWRFLSRHRLSLFPT